MDGSPAPPMDPLTFGKGPNAISACLSVRSSCPEIPVLPLPEHMLENTPFCFIEDCARGMLKMAVRWKTLGNTVAACGVGAGIWFLYMTRDIQLIPLASADRIFHSKYFAEFNPNGNPAIHDWHVKSVPLDQINPKLLDDRRKLLERFCGGVWAGNGKRPERGVTSPLNNNTKCLPYQGLPSRGPSTPYLIVGARVEARSGPLLSSWNPITG